MLGWLELAGDTGATVWLNGLVMSTTPMKRLQLQAGSYQLILTRPEHDWYSAEVAIEYNRISTVNYTLQKRPRKTAITLSMVLPGGGQIFQGYSSGWFYLELALALGYSALVFHQDFSVHCDTYHRSLDNYNGETDASMALIRRDIVQEDFDAMKKVENRRNICLGALGAVWLVNIVDIAF